MDIEVKKQEDPYKGNYTINLWKISKGGIQTLESKTQKAIANKDEFMETINDISLFNKDEKKKTSEPSTNKEEENYYFMKTLIK
ncbi:MAG: hypothetical protein RSC49_02160 [Clostridium sp.]